MKGFMCGDIHETREISAEFCADPSHRIWPISVINVESMATGCVIFNISIQCPAKWKFREETLKQKTEDTIMCRMA